MRRKAAVYSCSYRVMPVSEYNPVFVAALVAKLNDDSCWSNFNSKYRYYLFLVELSKISDLIRLEDLPPAPVPADNEQLDC